MQIVVAIALVVLAAADQFSDSVEYDDDLPDVAVDPLVHLQFAYHNYSQLTGFLRDVSQRYRHLTHLYSIGRSVAGRELWVLAVSSTPGEHVAGKAEVKYVGNIHGNEPISKEILLHFILFLVTRYGHDDIVTLMLDRMRIHFLPSMNPDGFEKSKAGKCEGELGRKNAHGVDLNRNFPDFFRSNPSNREPETAAVIRWMESIQFVLSASLHGGALVASYPYENSDKPWHVHLDRPNSTPDDDVFRHLAQTYASSHATMWKGLPCKDSRGFSKNMREFPNGTVNGAAWYTVTGGMQDYNYIRHGTMEVTLEVSCCKYPPATEIQRHWRDNKRALMAYLLEALRGVRGLVTDESGRPVGGAQLAIGGREERPFNATDTGEFWRILLNGSYVLQVTAAGYEPIQVPFDVEGDEATVVHVTLNRLRVSEPQPPTTPGGGITESQATDAGQSGAAPPAADQSERSFPQLSSSSFRPLGGVGLLLLGVCMIFLS